MNYTKYYNLEGYLFEDVHYRFHSDGYLGAFDFFSIVIWKANRAKSKIATKLLAKDPQGRRNLESICRDLTSELYKASDDKERLRRLMKDWNFALPMASAILSVLWPDNFTVYDYRVRERIPGFPNLVNLTDFEKIWNGFIAYKEKVVETAPKDLSLRDKDKYLWGESSALQLEQNIRQLFSK
jgi:hypothetical protein